MTIELTGVVVRNERRLRLVFSSPLDVSAFGTPAPAAYIVDNEDGCGVSPGISAAILVIGATTNVELALDADLATGALYRVTAIGIVGADTTVTTIASDESFRFGIPSTQTNAEPKASDADLLLYGRDIVWTGLDYLETPEGDLATVEGAQNVIGAVDRRMRGSPLPWAPLYSPRARQYVDAPSTALGTLRGKIVAQGRRDDRLKGIDAKLVLDDDDPTSSYFEITPTLTGGQTTAPINVNFTS